MGVSGAGKGLLTVGSEAAEDIEGTVEKGELVDEAGLSAGVPNGEPIESADGAGGTEITLPIEPGTGAAGTGGSSLIDAKGFSGTVELVSVPPAVLDPVVLELVLLDDVPPRP